MKELLMEQVEVSVVNSPKFKKAADSSLRNSSTVSTYVTGKGVNNNTDEVNLHLSIIGDLGMLLKGIAFGNSKIGLYCYYQNGEYYNEDSTLLNQASGLYVNYMNGECVNGYRMFYPDLPICPNGEISDDFMLVDTVTNFDVDYDKDDNTWVSLYEEQLKEVLYAFANRKRDCIILRVGYKDEVTVMLKALKCFKNSFKDAYIVFDDTWKPEDIEDCIELGRQFFRE